MSNPEDTPVVFLSGPRVYLRPVDTSDAERYVRWLNDPKVRAGLDTHLPLTLKSEREFLDTIGNKPDQIILAIVLRDGDRHVGGTGLHGIRWKDRSATFGILIGEEDCWGNGYGTEVTRLMLDYAFRTLNLHRVELGVYSTNPRAVRTYEKAGFVREGIRREAIFIDGQPADVLIYGVLAREYLSPQRP